MTAVPKSVIVIDPPRREWIRERPCTICALTNALQASPTECAHVHTRRNAGDQENLWPACKRHHAERHRWGIQTFQMTYGVVLEDVARRLHREYDKEQGWI
jgi:hypothetical protein